MSISTDSARATAVSLDENNLWVEFADGRRLAVPLSYFPRLLAATPEQRERYLLSGGGRGIHWEDLDEDVSVAGLLRGDGDRGRSLGST